LEKKRLIKGGGLGEEQVVRGGDSEELVWEGEGLEDNSMQRFGSASLRGQKGNLTEEERQFFNRRLMDEEVEEEEVLRRR